MILFYSAYYSSFYFTNRVKCSIERESYCNVASTGSITKEFTTSSSEDELQLQEWLQKRNDVLQSPDANVRGEYSYSCRYVDGNINHNRCKSCCGMQHA